MLMETMGLVHLSLQIPEPGPLGQALTCCLCAEFSCPWLGQRERYHHGGMIRVRPAQCAGQRERTGPRPGPDLQTGMDLVLQTWCLVCSPLGEAISTEAWFELQRVETLFLKGRLRLSQVGAGEVAPIAKHAFCFCPFLPTPSWPVHCAWPLCI